MDNWDWALSVMPYVTTGDDLSGLHTGVKLIHSLQYEEDRLNTSVRLGYLGLNEDTTEVDTSAIVAAVGVSYDIVASPTIVHRFEASVSSGMNLESMETSAGYSFNASLGERARLKLGVDFGETSSASAVFFNEKYRAALFGDELAGAKWLPSPNASMFWVF